MMTSNTLTMLKMCVLVFLLLHAKDVVGDGLQRGLFTCQRLNEENGNWDTKVSVDKGCRARLICYASGKRDRNRCNIYSRNEGEPPHRLPTNYSESDGLFIHNFGETDCSQTGTYECVCENVTPMLATVGVISCAPRPCTQRDPVVTYAAAHETRTIPLCIVSYSGINDTAYLNGTSIIAYKSSWSNRWSWGYKNTNFSTYQVGIEVKNVSDPDYGEHTFTIVSRQWEQYKMEHRITLKKPGPPDCPKELNVSENGTNHVQLRWTPGLNGGSEQSFSVLHSEDNVTWQTVLHVKREEATISDLNESTDHFFKVESSNKYGGAIGCWESKRMARTGAADSTDTETEEQSKSTYTIIMVVILVLILISAIIAGVCVYMRRKKLCRRNRPDQSNHPLEQNCNGQENTDSPQELLMHENQHF